jgi:hypothetical protein
MSAHRPTGGALVPITIYEIPKPHRDFSEEPPAEPAIPLEEQIIRFLEPQLYRGTDGLIDLKRDRSNKLRMRAVKKDIFLALLYPLKLPMKVLKEPAEFVFHHQQQRFRPLYGIVPVPTMRPDYSVVAIPGYDATTQLFYEPASSFANRALNLTPSRAEAVAAYEKLAALFVDFPFKPAEDIVNVVAFVLTLASRSATAPANHSSFMPAPILGVSASNQSCGKSLLIELASEISTGRVVSHTPAGNDADRCVLTGLRAGLRLISIDNIPLGKQYASALVASVATSEDALLRQYRTTDRIEFDPGVLFALNGNALRVDSDAAKRLIFADLWMENPQAPRTFQLPHIKAYVHTYWPEYYTAALTMILAWRHAGCPLRTPSSPLDKYREWERFIGGVLEFVGVKDFLAGHAERMRTVDAEAAATLAFFNLIAAEIPDALNPRKGFRPMDLTVPLQGDWKGLLPSLHLQNMGSKKAAQDIGHYLKAKRDTRIGDWLLRKRALKANDGARYFLQKVE